MQGPARPRVAVIGGGVVGLCCAFELHRHDAEVRVFERGQAGDGASWGNAGWVVPALSAPLAAPGAIKQAITWALKRESPVRIKPRIDRDLIRWIRHFARSTSGSRHHSGRLAKLLLGADTMAQFDALAAAGVRFEMHRAGLLAAALTDAGLEQIRREVNATCAAGYSGKVSVLDAASVRSLEPALSDDVVGAVHLEDERHVRPETLVRGLADYLLEHQVEIREHDDVHELERKPRRWQLRSTSGLHQVDRVVVAAGGWSAGLLRPLGIRLPIQPARGCSITAEGSGLAPKRPLKLLAARVACTPFERAVRLSGTFELNGIDTALDGARLDTVIRSARPYLRDWAPDHPELRWARLRSVSPDDLPLIGALPGHEGLYVATGHGTLGVTLAPATAALLAPIVADGHESDTVLPFLPDRFSRAPTAR